MKTVTVLCVESHRTTMFLNIWLQPHTYQALYYLIVYKPQDLCPAECLRRDTTESANDQNFHLDKSNKNTKMILSADTEPVH